MSNRLPGWVDHRIQNKDGTYSIVSLYIEMSGSTNSSFPSFPSRNTSSVLQKELEQIKRMVERQFKKMLDRHFNWSEDAVPTHRIPALVPPSLRRYDKAHPFPRPVPKKQIPHKGR